MNGMSYNERRLLWAILVAGTLASGADDQDDVAYATGVADRVLEEMLTREYLFDPALVDVKEDET